MGIRVHYKLYSVLHVLLGRCEVCGWWAQWLGSDETRRCWADCVDLQNISFGPGVKSDFQGDFEKRWVWKMYKDGFEGEKQLNEGMEVDDGGAECDDVNCKLLGRGLVFPTRDFASFSSFC